MKLSSVVAQEFFLKMFLSICVLLPTGSVFGVNIKFISLFILLITSVLFNRGRGLARLIIGMAMPIILVTIFILITEYKSRFSSESIDQAKDILVFFLMATLGYSLVDKDRRYEVITCVIINSLIFLGALKILIMLIAFSSGGSVASIVKEISIFFNTSLMTMESDDVAISRINFMSDYLLPVALYIVMSEFIKYKFSIKKTIVLIILTVSLLISLSRFLWGIGVFCIILAIISEINKYKSLVIVFSVFLLVFFLVSLPSVQELIEFRFSSQGAVDSDLTRARQFNAIFSSFTNYPMLGNGMGYYIPNLIRSYISRYSYELQIPALFMQIGIIGASASLLIIVGTLFTQIKGLSIKLTIAYIALIVAWLSGGFFNPVIFSSTGGVAFLLLYTVPDYLKRNKGEGVN